MSTKGILVARATEDDIEGLFKMASMMQCLFDDATFSTSGVEFDINSREDCSAAIKMLWAQYQAFSINRAAMNLSTLLNPANKLYDPSCDTLEFHPEIKAMRKEQERCQKSHESY